MQRIVKKTLVIGFYSVMFALYISNNIHLVSLAKKIEREMIVPYTRRFSSYEQDNSRPLRSYDGPLSPTPDREEESTNNESNVKIIYVTPTPSDISISETDLWTALSTYRRTHGKSDVQQSESLCKYARKRAEELYDRLQTNPEDPLDGHAGFSRDADSGYVFELTGYNTVGENLAYTPGYTSATQIIEWGWDTSPGHRSLQLSDDVTHGCIAGEFPIYVGIFTY